MTMPPATALDYLQALSADIRSAALATAAGDLLAGDAALLTRPREELVCAEDAEHVVLVEAGPHVMPAVLQQDLAAVLRDLRTH